MQTLFVGLLLASVSGVCFVAFKHPNGFAKLFPYLIAATTSILIGIAIWHVAVEISWMQLAPYIVEGSHVSAEIGKAKLTLPFAWVGFWYVAIVAYLWVNLRLPPFLQVTDQSESK